MSIPNVLTLGYNLYIGPTAPTTPNEDDIWYDTENQAWFQYVEGDWIATVGGDGFSPYISETTGNWVDENGDTGVPAMGPSGTGVQFMGSDTWANISIIPTPTQGDAWILTDATGAPAQGDGTLAAVDDWMVYGVSAWENTGPRKGIEGESAYDIAIEEGFIGTEQEWLDSLQGVEGPEGPPGESTNYMGNASWSFVENLSAPQQNDMWVLTEATEAPIRPDSGPARIGDQVVWNGVSWYNLGPLTDSANMIGFDTLEMTDTYPTVWDEDTVYLIPD